MISYAQNLEDVFIERCFSGQATGFYIDVGAADPLIDSVTMSFYERGWRGINIEPNPEFSSLLQRFRTRDVNLEVALSDTKGYADLRVFRHTGMSTFDDDNARRARDRGVSETRLRVPVTTLAAVCAESAPPVIDFLKIDVEGWEYKVIIGNDWRQFKPRLVVVEAVVPNSQEPCWSEWEPVLLDVGYAFVHFDGLNRFYLDRKDAALSAVPAASMYRVPDYRRYPEVAAIDSLTGGPLLKWRQAYMKRLQAYALADAGKLDEAVFLSGWPAEELDRLALEGDIAKCFMDILGRVPDDAGRLSWLAWIEAGRVSVRELAKAFLASEEFLLRRLWAGNNPLERN